MFIICSKTGTSQNKKTTTQPGTVPPTDAPVVGATLAPAAVTEPPVAITAVRVNTHLPREQWYIESKENTIVKHRLILLLCCTRPCNPPGSMPSSVYHVTVTLQRGLLFVWSYDWHRLFFSRRNLYTRKNSTTNAATRGGGTTTPPLRPRSQSRSHT